jgi:hypothetical protein
MWLAAIILIIIILIWITRPEISIKIDTGKFYTLDTGKPGPCVGIIAGVHGNERSGPIEVISLIQDGKLQVTRGKIKIVPCANVNGFRRNLRWRNWLFEDLNRIFNTSDPQVGEIIDYFSDCDIVVDFHEAWGWHLIDSNSTGNTIIPINCDSIAESIVDTVNKLPCVALINSKNPKKKFTMGEKYVICKYSGTLSCWMHKNARKYILVEVAGQNNIQPLDVRREIVRTIIFKLLECEKM